MEESYGIAWSSAQQNDPVGLSARLSPNFCISSIPALASHYFASSGLG